MPRKKSKPSPDDVVQHQYDFSTPSEPTLICIEGARGYVKGNIMIVSQRTASLIEFIRDVKVTPAELRALADVTEKMKMIEAKQPPSQVQATA